jgi:hypothetical protein
MSEIIKMDYAAMQRMKTVFHEMKNETDSFIGQTSGIANALSEGALIGTAGNAFVDQLQNTFVKSLKNLGAKYEEEADDIAAAMRFLQESDNAARGGF